MFLVVCRRSSKYKNPWRKMLPPLEHLDDCKGVHYRIQPNCYKCLACLSQGNTTSFNFVVVSGRVRRVTYQHAYEAYQCHLLFHILILGLHL